MAVHGGLLRLSTPGDGAIVDLTEGVRSVVRRSDVQTGVAVVFAVGSTVAVTTMEYEPGGVADLRALVSRLVPVEPPEGAEYAHNTLNGDDSSRRFSSFRRVTEKTSNGPQKSSTSMSSKTRMPTCFLFIT